MIDVGNAQMQGICTAYFFTHPLSKPFNKHSIVQWIGTLLLSKFIKNESFQANSPDAIAVGIGV